MSCEGGTVKFDVELDATKAFVTAQRINRLVSGTLRIVAKLCGSESLNALIASAEKTIHTLNRLRIAMHALQVARMASGDPLAWGLAGLTLAELAVDFESGAAGF